ncbi:NF-X1 type zinc finger [Necator americanus]|uniref:NF-X1 type zinc finger n=1 Tax=Necator americanus TaxID=51031 RepID=W2TVA8_NECAM|nr:NF-X1 type zinc finger [Necator americanus]ETN85584.1 NF-X1 type zinc finger [Necator americanus]
MGDVAASSSATTTSTDRGGRGRRRGYRGGRGGRGGGGGRCQVDSVSSGTEAPLLNASTATERRSNHPQPSDRSDGQNAPGKAMRPPNNRRNWPQRGRSGISMDPSAMVPKIVPQQFLEETSDRPQHPTRGRGSDSHWLPRQGGRGGFSSKQYRRLGGARIQPGHNDIILNPYAPPFVPAPEFVNNLTTPQEAVFNQRSFNGRGKQRRSFATNQTPEDLKEAVSQGVPKDYTRGNPQQHRNPPLYGISGVNRTRGNRDGQNNRKPTRPRTRRIHDYEDDQEKSMRDRLIQQLEDNCYECAICCQVIHARQGIWSCKTCYHMFHISGGCIINWAKKSKEEDNRWRCPTCQTKYEAIPYNYFCFCRKQINPPFRLGETPHSCGNVCGGQRAPGCPHPCNEPCHPGPCPECPVMLTRKCNCGAVQKAVRCGSAVEVKNFYFRSDCFCGLSTREIPCWEKGGNEKYSCGEPCRGFYSCGIHRCIRSCHLIGNAGCGLCPTAPERITHCPCGRCTLVELRIQRKSCQDSIPTCRNICGKVLKCGSAEKKHRCRALCHTGECPPCELNTSIVCRCRQVKRTLPCKEYVQFADGNEFLCEKRCKKRKSCGIHKCQEICNKRLSCGLHFCESICHAGQCPRCLNSSFEEQFCHCGRTMRPPPIPCGAPLPECDEPCARPHPCNHPVTHRCHGEERCPPCTALVERMCYGKHEIRKNIPCHIDAVSCGRLCEKPLGCGVHNCNRNCHAGDCMREGEKCTRPCMILRRPCEHPCSLPCHGTTPCPESECRQMVNVTCECGKRKSQMKCSEFEKMVGRLRAFEAEDSEGGQIPEPGVAALRRSASMEKLNCLPCDDECKKIARNKRLADALELVTDENGELEKEPTITYTEYLKAELRTNAAFVQEVETAFVDLLERLGDPTYLGSTLNYNFRPMPVEKRRFVHEYATFFSVDTVGVDDPPKRSVIATAKRGISRAPLVMLTCLLKYPGMLKSRGSVTLKSKFFDETKREEASQEDASVNSSMKALRGGRQFKKRVAPQLTRPPPLPQFNHFAALCSDDEDQEVNEPPSQQVPSIQEKDPNWWSDDENESDTTDNCVSEVVGLVEDLMREVCRIESFGNKIRELDSMDCKDSWSDDE